MYDDMRADLLYEKTGTSKQTELMHLFMSSAPPVKTAQEPVTQQSRHMK